MNNYQGNRSGPSTYSSPGRNDATVPLLEAYYDKDGNMIKEIFIGIPQKVAEIFFRQGLAIKQLRDFHGAIAKARAKAMLKGIEAARQGCF